MGNLTNINAVYQRMAQGYGFLSPHISAASGATTAAVAASGHISGALTSNNIGTTLPGTIVSFPSNTATTPKRLIYFQQGVGTNGVFQGFMGIFYKIGTLNMAATGDQFTHDAATFPILRTKYGQASQPLSLAPLVQVTTAPATTAPIFTLKNGLGTNGYVNENGTTVVGTKTFTMPSATTIVNSTYLLRLEDGSNGVRDIVNINVGTAGTAGAATIWGFEAISPMAIYSNTNDIVEDALFAPLRLPDINPGVATSGTVTAFVGAWILSAGTRSTRSIALGVND